jgi:two-component system chemotaxis response regulator CheY
MDPEVRTRILVVDDDQATRLCLAKVLEPAGEVVCAQDGVEALNVFGAALTEGRPFALVCMDICMPKLDGQEALQALRALETRHNTPPGQEAKVVMVTSLDDAGNVSEAYFRGQADGYVQKPLRLAAFKDELRKVGFLL